MRLPVFINITDRILRILQHYFVMVFVEFLFVPVQHMFYFLLCNCLLRFLYSWNKAWIGANIFKRELTKPVILSPRVQALSTGDNRSLKHITLFKCN